MLWRSGHYWEIIVAILTEIERGSKIRRPQVPHEGGGGVVLVTSGEHSGVSLLNEAHMALGDAAAYRRDLAKALGLYSKVKTSLAAWNQAQVMCNLIMRVIALKSIGIVKNDSYI